MRRHVFQCATEASQGPKRDFYLAAGVLYNSKMTHIGLNDGLTHAEIRAYKMIKNPYKKFSLLVVRINRSGEFLCSKPCADCIRYLRRTNIDKIWYFDNEQNLHRESIKTISNEYITCGNRLLRTR